MLYSNSIGTAKANVVVKMVNGQKAFRGQALFSYPSYGYRVRTFFNI